MLFQTMTREGAVLASSFARLKAPPPPPGHTIHDIHLRNGLCHSLHCQQQASNGLHNGEGVCTAGMLAIDPLAMTNQGKASARNARNALLFHECSRA